MIRASLSFSSVLLALVVSFTAPVSAFAEYTIATVDINRILNESDEAKTERKRIDKLSAAAKEKVDSRRASLKKTEDKIKSGKIKPDSSAAEDFRADAKDFSRFVKDTEEDLRRKFMKSNQKLTEKTLKLIQDYAKSENLDLVLDKSAKSRGPVLFGTPSVDVTDAIIKRMNS